MIYIIKRGRKATATSLKKGGMGIKQEERRRSPRVSLHVPMRYQIGGRSEFDNTASDNISIGGMSFVTENFIAPATSLILEINILSRILLAVGKVVWSNALPHSDRKKTGIKFTELDFEASNFLADYINMQINKS